MSKGKSTGSALAVIALLLIVLLGAIYWFSGGVGASKGLTTRLLKEYRYLGTVLTIALIAVGGFVLNRIQRRSL